MKNEREGDFGLKLQTSKASKDLCSSVREREWGKLSFHTYLRLTCLYFWKQRKVHVITEGSSLPPDDPLCQTETSEPHHLIIIIIDPLRPASYYCKALVDLMHVAKEKYGLELMTTVRYLRPSSSHGTFFWPASCFRSFFSWENEWG